MDALYTIFLRENDRDSLNAEEIAEKLKKPVFVLYLGRKSCPPALPLEPLVIEAETLPDAVKKAVFKIDISNFDEQNILNKNGKKDLIFEECFRSEISGDVQIYERRDIPLSRKRWQFDTRKEYHTVIGG